MNGHALDLLLDVLPLAHGRCTPPQVSEAGQQVCHRLFRRTETSEKSAFWSFTGKQEQMVPYIEIVVNCVSRAGPAILVLVSFSRSRHAL